MKISYVVGNRIPSGRANGYAIMKLCEEWAALGHEIRLIVPGRKHSQTEDAFAYYDIKPIFSIQRPCSSDLLGGHQIFVRIKYVIDMLSYVYALLRLKFSSEDVLYTREYLLALVLPKRRLFLEIHALPNTGFLMRRALSRVQGIVAISSGLRDAIVRLGVDPQKICIAHDGVDLGAFENAAADKNIWREFNIDPEKKIVLYTGHFYKWKGVDTLIEAARLLSPNVHVVLMGGTDDELVNFQKYTGQNLSILPYQPTYRVPAFLKSADALVIPNSATAEISRVYASPLKLFEYMAAKVPIVASDVPSIREILDDGSAFWFTPDDPESCARAIADALLLKTESAEKAARAHSVVEAYTWNARAQKIAEYFTR